MIRLNYQSYRRKKKLTKEIDKSKVSHLETTVQCESEWYGNSYGGFYINPSLLNEGSIIYSFGIGKDISFDQTCIKRHHCRVYGFDPTPKSISFIKGMKKTDYFKFNDYGITDGDSGLVDFFLPHNPKGISGSLILSQAVNETRKIQVKMRSFSDITKELGHSHVDVVKMDIEGSEYDVLKSLIASKIKIDQILVEFHDRLFDLDNFKSREVTEHLKENGYEIFACSRTYEEVSFIHKSRL